MKVRTERKLINLTPEMKSVLKKKSVVSGVNENALIYKAMDLFLNGEMDEFVHQEGPLTITETTLRLRRVEDVSGI